MRLDPGFAEDFKEKEKQDNLIAEATAAVAKEPNRPDLYLRRGLAREAQGFYLQALADYGQAALLAPTDSRARIRAGIMFQSLADTHSTIACCSEIIRKNPRDLQAVLVRGVAFERINLADLALKDYTSVISIDPQSALAYRCRGDVYLARKDYPQAIADYTEALKIDPKWARTLVRRGDAYRLSAIGGSWYPPRKHDEVIKAHDQAIADHGEALKIEPTLPATSLATACSSRAQQHAEQKHWLKARTDLAKAIELEDQSVRTAYQLALVSLADHDLKSYRKVCQELLDRNMKSSDRVTLNLVAWTCCLGPGAVAKPDQLVTMTEKALEAKPPSPYIYLNTLGAAYFRAEKYEAATVKLKEAISAHGKGGGPTDQIFLAMAHHKLGHASEAKDCLARARSLLAESKTKLSWSSELINQLLLEEAQKLIQKKK